jgi:hypothetical protein
MQNRITLSAGVPKRQEFQGTTMVLLDIGAAMAVDMTVEVQSFGVEELRGVKSGLRLRAPGAGFTGAVFTSATDTTLEVVVSRADISVNYTEGSTVNANILGTVPVSAPAPLAVIPDRGGPGNPVNVVGISYTDAPATAIVDRAPVACGPVAAVLLTASATRKRARFANIGTDPVTLGTTGHTWAKRVIVLEAGDVWVESDAANLAWTAITDAATNASVTAQEVNA